MEGAAGDRGETLFWGPSFILTFANGASLTSEGAALATVCTLPRYTSAPLTTTSLSVVRRFYLNHGDWGTTVVKDENLPTVFFTLMYISVSPAKDSSVVPGYRHRGLPSIRCHFFAQVTHIPNKLSAHSRPSFCAAEELAFLYHEVFCRLRISHGEFELLPACALFGSWWLF